MGLRHKARIIAFQTVYSWEINHASTEELLQFDWMHDQKQPDAKSIDFAQLLITGVLQNIDAIDAIIKKHSEKWDFSRIAKVELAILRISIYSLLYQKEIPATVNIDEAITLAKYYGSNDSYRFINGVLDGVRKTYLL